MSFHYADEKVYIEMDSSNFPKHELIFFANGVFQEPQRPISSETTFYWEYLPEEQMLSIHTFEDAKPNGGTRYMFYACTSEIFIIEKHNEFYFYRRIPELE